jgi:hypothetical protein
LSNSNAKPKLTTIVVRVKKRFIPACCHLLYLNFTKGTAVSISQKKAIPPAKIKARCEDGIVEK